jgi:hypothetical protein
MRDFLARFRFGDFAAYFLPGMALLTGAAAVLSFTPLRGLVEQVVAGASWLEAVVFACAAYLCGALISGSSYRLVPPFYRVTRLTPYAEPRECVQPAAIAPGVRRAFLALFGEVSNEPWSVIHFYLIRSVVHEKLPHASGEAMRQNDLSRLRENMLVPLLVWCFAVWMFAASQFDALPVFAVGLSVTAAVLTYLFGGRLACRAADNRAREVREICAAFLVGDRLRVWEAPQVTPEATATATLALPPRPPEILSVTAPTQGSA